MLTFCLKKTRQKVVYEKTTQANGSYIKQCSLNCAFVSHYIIYTLFSRVLS